MENEVWKDVVGYEGLYEVSNLGNVKSLPKELVAGIGRHIVKRKEKILKKQINTCGYYSVNLSKNKVPKTAIVHQIVAEAFLNHKRCGFKLVIDHINDNKLDNRVENLQIVTHRFNVKKTQIKYSSNYKGVHIRNMVYKLKNGDIKKYNQISSQISINKKTINLGSFKTEEEAHLAYQNAILKYEL